MGIHPEIFGLPSENDLLDYNADDFAARMKLDFFNKQIIMRGWLSALIIIPNGVEANYNWSY